MTAQIKSILPTSNAGPKTDSLTSAVIPLQAGRGKFKFEFDFVGSTLNQTSIL